MRIETGQGLIDSLRELGNGLKKRLWVAVPYIGSFKLVRSVLGEKWLDFDNKIDVRLITDYSNPNNVDHEALKNFRRAGRNVERSRDLKTITGLHAKVYILDDNALITSANLTATAFSKRHEIGVFLDRRESREVIACYNKWWKREAENFSIKRTQRVLRSEAEEMFSGQLKKLWDLPADPGEARKWVFLNTNRQESTGLKCEEDMIRCRKASAYYKRHNWLIDKLKEGDVVFLYGNTAGIVAMGEVKTGDRFECRPIHVPSERKNEEYYMKLSNFKKLKRPMSAAAIKQACGENKIFRGTMFSVDEAAGEKIRKAIVGHHL